MILVEYLFKIMHILSTGFVGDIIQNKFYVCALVLVIRSTNTNTMKNQFLCNFKELSY